MATADMTINVPTFGPLRCLPCTEQAIKNDGDRDTVPCAWTLVSIMQVVNTGAGIAAASSPVPMCYDCTAAQIRKQGSKLAVA